MRKNVHIKGGMDGLLVASPHNITYLLGFRSRDSYLLVSKRKNVYFTDGRYAQESRELLKGCGLSVFNGTLFGRIATACKKLKCRRLGFEEEHTSVAFHRKLSAELKGIAELVPTHGIIEGMRAVKSKDELSRIRRAVMITLEAFEFIRRRLSPGMKETEVAAELERFIRYNGAYSSSFDIIVASGPNSALPHHLTSERKLKAGEPVLIDLGVDYDGYKSDLTRTFFLGKMTPAFQKIYGIVAKAQDRAIRRIKPEVLANTIDTCARHYITSKGYGGFFSHSLGHGVGLQVHEEPHVSYKSSGVRLKAGMVFTVEPGIYLPHRFGVRTEDMVLVTRKGCEVLSGSLNKRH